MSFSIGIVGLPNVGKSTLFQALTKKEVEIANYPFATIDPNVGVVEVPDERLDKLAALFDSEKRIPTVVEFVDIAGLVRGANMGEGLGNQFLAHIREVDSVLYLVRAFESAEIHHVEGSVDPIRDIGTITTELMLKDLETVEGHLEKVRKEERGGSKGAREERELLEQVRDDLANGIMARPVPNLQLLTAKPGIFLVNTDKEEIDDSLKQETARYGFPVIAMNVHEELEGAGFSETERADLGLSPSKLPKLIKLGYEVLELITFFTAGETESRAWTVRSGATAQEAAGVIHTDFEKHFIRADIIIWSDLLRAGGWSNARAEGIVRTEGKEYVMRNGDVMVVKHGA